MDGQAVWPRTAIGGKPAVYVTRNGGKSWQRLARRPAGYAGMVHGAAPGHVRRCRTASRTLFRYDGRRGVEQQQRRRVLALHRSPSPRNLLRYVRFLMGCTVRIASPLRSYTQGADSVAAEGTTLCEVLADLDRRFPGIRFRMIDEQDGIRRHIRLFVNSSEARSLQESVQSRDTVHLICALSGG